ncbi:hypothetical protein JCGZ_21535 [Jatropha curcas]|uniref:Uncharacterized protein n=1 Tax=Jatropha curcas TaxID=180498 RepID=A0A067JNH9_JATCU|nr:hypothetical protein JCGZ_21535 [Jatropha curcas]
MAKLGFLCLLITIVLVLLFSAKVESGRPLDSNFKKRNVRQLYEALNEFANTANRSGYEYPDRKSPGGPDPQHHSKHD